MSGGTLGEPQVSTATPRVRRRLRTCRRVLVLGSSAPSRESLARSLADLGHDVVHHASLLDPEARCQLQDTPDLILLDLPEDTRPARETLSQMLGATDRFGGVPILVHGPMASPGLRAAMLNDGAADYLIRPVDPVEMQARLRAALRMRDLVRLLDRRAHLYALTRLGNRHALADRLHAEWARSQRGGWPLALIMIDIDHFKDINDAHGHALGDRVLRRTARQLRAAVRPQDFVARYGGEEFVVLATECDRTAARALAERLRAAVAERPLRHGCTTLPVTISAGVAAIEPAVDRGGPAMDEPGRFDIAAARVTNPCAVCAKGPGECVEACLGRHTRTHAAFGADTPSALLIQADLALYRAKAAGRDRVWVWDATPQIRRPDADSA